MPNLLAIASIREVEILVRFECNITIQPPSPVIQLTRVRNEFEKYLLTIGIRAENISDSG